VVDFLFFISQESVKPQKGHSNEPPPDHQEKYAPTKVLQPLFFAFSGYFSHLNLWYNASMQAPQEASLKPISTSTPTFRTLREGGFVYVDKTAILHRLVAPYQGVFFFSRPRRFGKSLTISTLAEIFKGNQDLFKGLAIYDLPYDWKPYPVIRIDLGSKHASTAEDLTKIFNNMLDDLAQEHSQVLEPGFPHERFLRLIHRLAGRSGKVVILIDEYDKPILGNIDNPHAGEILKVLKAFYSVVKTADEHIRFAFLTGVSKFSKVSVFSDLNNLTDTTMDSRFATLAGYTQEELEASFADHIDRLGEREAVSRPEMLAKIRTYYNGYRFSRAETTVYNPVSVGKLLDRQEFANYWFETGTPRFLLTLMKSEDFFPQDALETPVNEAAFASYEIEKLSVLPLLFQTGYLTIAAVLSSPLGTTYRMGFPNLEVEQSFTYYFLSDVSNIESGRSFGAVKTLVDALNACDLEKVFAQLRCFFASIPSDIQLKREKYYQSIFFAIFKLIGLEIATEIRTADGRIDAVVKAPQTIFIFEFKLKGTAQSALKQIHAKRYYEPFLPDARKLMLVGVSFSPKTRNINKWLAEEVSHE
jgi:hypothetical protein